MTKQEALQIAKPILFNTEMTKAVQNGTKTATRRLIKPRSKNAYGFFVTHRVSDGAFMGVYDYDEEENAFDNPHKEPYKVGDILYVRETWCEYDADHVINEVKYAYRANATPASEEVRKSLGYKWKPSIQMPKEAARIFLRVTNVRVEKLNDISFNDILSEGIVIRPEAYNDPDNAYLQAVNVYQTLWNSTIKKSDLELYGWNANPWVRVIKFERIEVTK